jgi:Helix-turn-helix domain
MTDYPATAAERAIKIQEVILRAMAKRITWGQTAEILGISDRGMRRWRQRYEEHDYDGLFDRRGASRVRSGCRWSKPRKCCSPIERNTGLAGDRPVKKGRKRGVHRKRGAPLYAGVTRASLSTSSLSVHVTRNISTSKQARYRDPIGGSRVC